MTKEIRVGKFEFYEYQQEDIDKLVNQSYALIGSEMGTGKTHIGIELGFQWWRQVFEDSGENLPILIICPIDVMESWRQKYAMQYPMMRVCVIDRKNREDFKDSLLNQEAEVYIMHWAAVNLLTDWFISSGIVFSCIIADEVHKISNRNAKTTQNLKKLKTYTKLALSGTASGDKPWNLWSILNWLDKKSFSSFWKFVDKFVEEEYEYRGSSKYRKFVKGKNLRKLHWLISPYYVRHLKSEQCCELHPNGVMDFLPPKVYEKLYVELSPIQRKAYDEMEKQMVAWLDDDTPLVAPVVIAKLTRLSQITLAQPIITTVEGPEEDIYTFVDLTMPSSKYDALREFLDGYDKPVVVMTSSKKMAYLTADALRKDGITACVLSGNTKPDVRKDLVDEFVAGEYRVFIGVIAAVAEGIDGLQHGADTVVFLDRHRSAIKNAQAEDRLHRGGQKHTVTIVDVIAKDTIDEEWVLERLPEKWQRIREVLDVYVPATRG